MTYKHPDTSYWQPDDPRHRMTAFDEEDFRKRYNEWMPYEQPPIRAEGLSMSKIESLMLNVSGSEVPYENALDVGCGNGRFLAYLGHSKFIDAGIGIDVSDAMVANAKFTAKNNDVTNVVFIRSAIEDYLPDRKFNLVIAVEVLEHIFNLRCVLAKIKSFMSGGGIFCGATPKMRTCDAPVHLHYFTKESLFDLLNNFFLEVNIDEMDLTGAGEYHLAFSCRRDE